jgi:hypothetical protein
MRSLKDYYNSQFGKEPEYLQDLVERMEGIGSFEDESFPFPSNDGGHMEPRTPQVGTFLPAMSLDSFSEEDFTLEIE